MNNNTLEAGPRNPSRGANSIFIQILLILCVLAGALALAYHFIQTGPKPKARVQTAHHPLVQIQPITFQSHKVIIEAMGTVIAAREVSLASGVAGDIVQVPSSLLSGSLFKKHETILTINPIDYQLEVLQRKQDLELTKKELELEMGNQRIANREYELLDQEVSVAEENLMLRRPQLEQKQIAVKIAEAKLARAKLDLSRTEVTAPFNAVILESNVNLGSRVSATTSLVRLAPTDEIYLELTVPVEKLRWLEFADPKKQKTGSQLSLVLQEGAENTRTGYLLRLGAELEPKGRMAQVYARVADPLCLLSENKTKPKLLLGSYIKAIIQGKEAEQVAVISRDHLHEGNTVWLMTPDSKLTIRKISILASTRDEVYIDSGVSEGEQLIISPLANPVEGSTLRRAASTDKPHKTGQARHQLEPSGEEK